MKLTFEEKKLLYAYGCADLELTRKRWCMTSAGSWRTKRWQTGTTRCSTSSVPRWSIIP